MPGLFCKVSFREIAYIRSTSDNADFYILLDNGTKREGFWHFVQVAQWFLKSLEKCL